MVPKISTKMPEIPLFPSCLQPHTSIVHAQTCMHTCVGVTPNPPTPTKNLKAQILLEAKIWHIMSLDAKLQIFMKVWGGGGGGVWHQTSPTTTPKLQLDFKSKKSSCSLGVVVGGVSGIRPPPPPPLNFNLTLSQKKSSWSLGVLVGGVWHQTPPHHHP